MQQKIQIMLQLQDDMNSKVNKDWREKGFAWYRAIWVECAEMLDHYGWKWWKKQTPDIEQVTLELIDIWHFGLSILLLEQVNADAISQQLQNALDGEDRDNTRTFADVLEEFVADTLKTQRFNVTLFARLMRSIGLSFDDLYSGYVGKNVLNFFISR